MVYNKLISVLLIALATFNHCTMVQSLEMDDVVTSPDSSTQVESSTIAGSTRSGRVVKVFKEPKYLYANLKRTRTPPKLLARADRLSLSPSKRFPVTYRKRVTLPHRRQAQRFVHDGAKTSRYSQPKFVPYIGNSKTNVGYHPQTFANAPHPNALPPVNQQSFKPSPHFDGQALARPIMAQITNTALFSEFNQYPIPQSPSQSQPQLQQQQHPPAHPHMKYPTQNSHESFVASGLQQPVAPWNYYHQQSLHSRPRQEPLLQPQHHVRSPPPAPYTSNIAAQQSYSVYEDPEISEHAEPSQNYPLQHQPIYQPQSQPHYAAISTEPISPKRAHEYLKFMNSNDYFLPKQDPNYKEMDAAKDRLGYEHYQQQQQQDFSYSKPSAETAGATNYKQPIRTAQLFYQLDAAPKATFMQSEYPADNDIFVVNSDGNKAVKHITERPMPALKPKTTQKTKPTAAYAQVRYEAGRRRTPEPVRFEFTERDAVPPAQTSTTRGQLRNKAKGKPSTPKFVVPTSSSKIGKTSSSATATTATATSTTFKYGTNISGPTKISPNKMLTDDIEDGEDIHDDSSDNYGRVPHNLSTSSPAPPVPEQTDNEEYCERICSLVHDDDEQIVCGSDGYMYTGEAQMECYASCLRIDVTIQSKGSCNAS